MQVFSLGFSLQLKRVRILQSFKFSIKNYFFANCRKPTHLILMSLVTSTPQQICNSPLNNSRSKMLFSFPKAARMTLDTKNTCSHAFYDLPPVRATRTTNFGYGSKYDFTRGQANNPPPNAYSLKAEITPNAKKGFSFGLSREQMLVTGGAFVGDKTSPGPGAYDVRETNKVSLAFSFRPRTNSTEAHHTSQQAPGPGTYPLLETISPKGKLFVSKYKSASTTVFAPATSKRFGETNEELGKPGPGAYNSGGEINKTGFYYVSKYKSSNARTIGGGAIRKQASAGTLRNEVPGPGSYKIPSDFGHYESKSHFEGAKSAAATAKN